MTQGPVPLPALRDALTCIRYGRSLAGNPLVGLTVVRLRLRADALADSAESREWALASVLEAVVRDRLARLRGRDAVPGEPTIDVERRLLGADFASDSHERQAWSMVYHRFIADIGLQMGQIAALVGADRRTLVRRQQAGLLALAQALQRAEVAASQAERAGGSWAAGSTAPTHDPASMRTARRALAAQPLGRFVGRTEQCVALKATLAERRLVTIVGPGGCGKTRLALEVCSPSIDAFPGGAWFVPLDEVPRGERVWPAVLAAVTAGGERADRAPVDEVAEQIAGRAALLILDNCEHVLAAAARVAAQLVADCPSLVVLTTSREPLRAAGEHVHALGPLRLPDGPTTDLGRLAAVEAVALFVDRAQAALPSFVLSAGNAEAVAGLCTDLDGLPLAIELAAARVGAMAVGRIRERMHRRARTMHAGGLPPGHRHQTLDDVVDWSMNLLEPRTAACFRRLGVLAGEWDLEVAVGVCADDDPSATGTPAADAGDADAIALAASEIEELVFELVGKSLVVAVHGDDGFRYRMLNTLRTAALDRLSAFGEAERVAARHAWLFAALAEELAAACDGPMQAGAVARMTALFPNVRAAAAWALDHELPELSLRIGIGAGRYCQIRGRPGDGLDLLLDALAHPLAGRDASLRLAALERAGGLARQSCDYDLAARLLTECASAYEAAGNDQGLANTLRVLGTVADERGRPEEARAHYLDALARYEALGDGWGMAAARNNIGLLSLHAGQAVEAVPLFEASLSGFRRAADRWAEGVVLLNLGHAELDLGRFAAAEALYRASLEIAGELDDDAGIGAAHKGLAEAAEGRGDLAAARSMLAAAIGHLRASHDLQAVAEWLESMAGLDARSGRPIAAVRGFAAADRLRAVVGASRSPRSEVHCATHLAALRAALSSDDLEAAWQAGASARWEEAVRGALDDGDATP